MEIPHGHHGRRGWRGLLGEFLMIAVAVFVGSMGEYYREHRVMAERRDESLTMMLHNLASDQQNIDSVLAHCDRGIANLARTKMSAYRYHSGAISRAAYLRLLADDLPNAYSWWTFFMDAAAFNSMSAGGLVSLVKSPELKSELSMYYEVLRHRLDDNSKLVDAEAGSYYRESFPFHLTADTSAVPPEDRLSPQADVAFYLSLGGLQERALADRFVLDTDGLIQRVVVYRALLQRIKEQNRKLDALIRHSL